MGEAESLFSPAQRRRRAVNRAFLLWAIAFFEAALALAGDLVLV